MYWLGPRVGHRIVGIHDRKYPALQRCLISLEPSGITRAIPELMVMENEIRNMEQLLGTTRQGVPDLHGFTFFLGRFSGLEENSIGDARLIEPIV